MGRPRRGNGVRDDRIPGWMTARENGHFQQRLRAMKEEAPYRQPAYFIGVPYRIRTGVIAVKEFETAQSLSTTDSLSLCKH
jgi:hypothetical protein